MTFSNPVDQVRSLSELNQKLQCRMRQQVLTVLWPSSAFRYTPLDVLSWDLDVAQFAVDAVLIRFDVSILVTSGPNTSSLES
jgi:hypothetical protein